MPASAGIFYMNMLVSYREIENLDNAHGQYKKGKYKRHY